MSTFPLRIGTPDGLLYEGEVARLVCRTINGDLAILPRHCNYCTALGMGEAHIILEDGSRKNAACIGGMLSVMNGTAICGNNLGVGRRYRYRESGRCQKTCGKPDWQKAVSAIRNIGSSRQNCKEHWFVSE